MSKVLGAIHHWLYRKIEFQNGLVERLSDMITSFISAGFFTS